MDESYIRLELPDDIFNLTTRLPRVNRLREERRFLRDVKLLDLVVMPRVKANLVSVILEQFGFGADNRVFASKLLVCTVDEKNFHA